MRIESILVSAALVAGTLAGCGDDVPDADQLPLAPGLEVGASKVGHADDNQLFRALIITASDARNARQINDSELAFLKDRGWRIREHGDGTANAGAPDDALWTFIGLDQHCRDLSETFRESDRAWICVSLGETG